MSIDLFRLVQRHAAAGLGIKLGARKAAEIAVGIANVGDGKLKITRAAVIQNFAEEFQRAFFGRVTGLEKSGAVAAAGTVSAAGGLLARLKCCSLQLDDCVCKKSCGQTFFRARLIQAAIFALREAMRKV